LALVLDTGPPYAALDRREHNYHRCRRLVEATRERLGVPSPVLVEVDQLLARGRAADRFVEVLDDIAAGAYLVEDLTIGDYVGAGQICERNVDYDVGFVEAAVLAIVERLNEPKPATLDHRHFGILHPRHVDTPRLVPD
jgi:predicted nucleic acid-binding protein